MAMPRFCPRVGIAVDVAAIDDDIVRQPVPARLRGRTVAERDDVADADPAFGPNSSSINRQ